MNYQIAPFPHFKRTTALRAVLKGERVTAIPNADAAKYKTGSAGTYRLEIDADKTLAQFDTKFAGPDPYVFKTASEICEMYLVPKNTGETAATMPAFWQNNSVTGDNVRERPYATLYPRLTTKSNTFTVHYTVQTLKQANRGVTGNWKTWNEKTDQVTGEYRGSAIIERYVDLEDPDLPDFATLDPNSKDTLDQHCKLRVIQTRKFAP
jgi:hypothetical protein